MPGKKLAAEKKQLVERLGVHFEKIQKMPPLAARIFATLILNGEQGATFDGLVLELEASKSSICTHLNSLEAQQKIRYFTKCGDRKRYYSPCPGYIRRKIDLLLTQWRTEIELQEQMLSYKSSFNSQNPENPISLQVHENALNFLTHAVSYFEKEKTHHSTFEESI